MSRYIEPTTDFGFKKLFGEEKSKNVLKSFLFHLLELESPIVDISFLKQEQLPDSRYERVGVYDIYCIDEKDNRFIVEMPKVKQIYFKDRALYYATFPIFQQAPKGGWNYRLNPVYCIGILDFTFAEDERYLRRIQLSDIETHEIFYDKLTFVFIELPKFNKDLSELKSYADKWLYFLRHLTELDEIPSELSDDAEMDEAFRIAEITAMTGAERYQYEDSLKSLRDEYSILQTARIEGRNEGKTEGRMEGKAESLLSLIELRFEQMSEFIEKKVRAITDEEILLAIQKLALKASTLQEFQKAIDNLGNEKK
ncbi:Rpn family recombination-promoting nuclease/putative transposase [Candidatus Poribacteria bacterium]|nr:Rpn family recombination-promoting nuclease/putative transposase [Candidatus Poribacteria bacterium]